jgi:hypothetical protein
VGLFKKWIEIRGIYIAMATPIKTAASSTTQRILSLTNHLKDSSNTTGDKQKAKMSAPYKFQGWMGLDKDADKGKMVWQEYEPKTWTEDDVDIKITHCGICGSDLHTLRSGWVRICQEMSHETWH